ncbi:MAG: hypothetical protein PHE99_07535 [Bacteroidales bacterium]|nr:hypothetical protein [Bacteroidales bacterium]
MKTQATVIDLHIEKIAKGYRSFTPGDALLYQVELFEQTLQTNRFKKGKRFDFVHGGGSGVLRAELIKILNQKFPTYIYEDAPFVTYGFQGAIRVTIK